MENSRHSETHTHATSTAGVSNNVNESLGNPFNHSSNISLPKPSYSTRNSVSGASSKVPTNSSLTSLNLGLGSNHSLDTHQNDPAPNDICSNEEDEPKDHDITDLKDTFIEFDLTDKRRVTSSSISGTNPFTSNNNTHTHTVISREELEDHHKNNNEGLTNLGVNQSSDPIEPEAENHDGKRRSSDFFDMSSPNEWKEMPTVTEYDFYNERGDLEFKHEEHLLPSVVDDSDKMNSSKGYTRIAAEEQATKYTQLDSKTEFLFQDHQHNIADTDKIDEEDSDYDEYDNYLSDDNINPVKKLQSMKSMLKESERFAYVGTTKLITVDMATELAKIKLSTSNKIAFLLSNSQKNFSNWTLYVMNKLYDHMELTEEEKIMIEKLSIHGVEVEDLCTSLIKCEVIDNPLYEDSESDTNSDRMPQDKSDEEVKDEERKIGEGEEIEKIVALNKDQLPAYTEEDNASKENHEVNEKMGILRPEDISKQSKITIDLKWTIICDLFLILLSDGYYDARSRELLLTFARHLDIPALEVYQFERRITDNLEIDTNTKSIENKDESLNDKHFVKRRAAKDNKKKLVYIGLATLGGGLVIGLSAGLLAPVIGAGIAAGLTTIGISGTAGFLAGVGGTAIVTTTGVITGASIGSRGMQKRMGAVKTFEFRPLHNNKRTSLIITVSGWMNSKVDDVRLPFSTIDPVMGDLFSLLWEPEMLQSMGQTIGILATEALTQSIQQILGATILTALMASLQLPMALSKLGYLLDNPWNVSLDRAWSAGKILADTLVSGNLGVRPITLVGFSLGARLIYSCLIELAKRGAFGIVENVILFGSPIAIKTDKLALARSVVSGKFVNGYSKKDWVLGYLFRATSGGLQTVAGLTELKNVYGVENFDCTDYVTGHMEYRKAIPLLLSKLGWEVLSEEFVEIDEPDPEESEKTRKLVHEFDEAREKMMQDDFKRKKSWKNWFKPKKKDWWEIYEEGSSGNKDKDKEEEGSRNILAEEAPIEPPRDPETMEPIFDVDALLDEVHDLENLAELDMEGHKKSQQKKQPYLSKHTIVNTTNNSPSSSFAKSRAPSYERSSNGGIQPSESDKTGVAGTQSYQYEEYTIEETETNGAPHTSCDDYTCEETGIQMSFGNDYDDSRADLHPGNETIEMSFGDDCEIEESAKLKMSFGDPFAEMSDIDGREEDTPKVTAETSNPQKSFPESLTKPPALYVFKEQEKN